MTTATIDTAPFDADPRCVVVRVHYSDGRESLHGVAHLDDAAGAPDPTGWVTGTLAQAERDVLIAIRKGVDTVEI